MSLPPRRMRIYCDRWYATMTTLNDFVESTWDERRRLSCQPDELVQNPSRRNGTMLHVGFAAFRWRPAIRPHTTVSTCVGIWRPVHRIALRFGKRDKTISTLFDQREDIIERVSVQTIHVHQHHLRKFTTESLH